MEGPGIQVRNARLPCERDRLAQCFGQRRMDIQVVAQHLAAIRERNPWNIVFVRRAEAKQTVDLAKAASCLSASELAIGITHRKKTIALGATLIDVEILAFLTQVSESPSSFRGVSGE